MKYLSAVPLALAIVMVLPNVLLGTTPESQREPLDNRPFEILYFEKLPAQVFQEPTTATPFHTLNITEGIWSFEAFGKRFRVSLTKNSRLVRKLPQTKRKHLEQTMDFFRGTLAGIPGSWIRLTRTGQHWSGMIWDQHEAYFIDPLSVIAPALQTLPTKPLSGHAIYRISDTRDLGTQTCAMGKLGEMKGPPISSFGTLMEELEDRVGVSAQGATRNIDMAVVTDREFTSANTNPDQAVIARMNVVDGIFSEQLNVQISLVNILTLQQNGTLTSTDPQTLLDQFSELTSSSSFQHPGIAHLFSGRNLDGSTVGIAFLRSLCDARFGVGVDQIIGSGTAGALTVAHELGHNFGAPHDNEMGSPCASTPETFLMNPYINGSDQFSPCSLSQIQPIVNQASCLTLINIDQADLQPRFQSTPQNAPLGISFSSILSVTNNGQTSSFNTRAEISIPNGLSLEKALTNAGSCSVMGISQATCLLNSISPGAEPLITLTLKGTATGSFTLQATVSADNESNPTNNSTKGTIIIDSGSGSFPPPIAAPAPGTPLTASTVMFTGAHTSQDAQHWVYVGSTPGAKNFYSGGLNGNHQFTVSNLPATGTIYVKYFSRTCSTCTWQHQMHSYSMQVN